jgi:RNA methyltransferase, TrmH family
VRRISSRSNPLVARFREVARGRGPAGVMLLDGEHLIGEALASGVEIETVALTEAQAGLRLATLVERLENGAIPIVSVPAPVMEALTPVHHPSGIAALARAVPSTLEQVLARTPQLVLVLDGIQDAGNVGAIIRAADGCGATGVITTTGTADPFGWKALRGAMGSTFRVPIALRQPADDVVATLKRRGIAVVAAVPHGGTPLPAFELQRPVALLLGGEGAGLADDLVARADERLSIPMRAPVESLNVASTAAVILYEASKQRNGYVSLPRP